MAATHASIFRARPGERHLAAVCESIEAVLFPPCVSKCACWACELSRRERTAALLDIRAGLPATYQGSERNRMRAAFILILQFLIVDDRQWEELSRRNLDEAYFAAEELIAIAGDAQLTAIFECADSLALRSRSATTRLLTVKADARPRGYIHLSVDTLADLAADSSARVRIAASRRVLRAA